MKQTIFFCFLFLFSTSLPALTFKTQPISLDVSIDQPATVFSNGLIHLHFPVAQLENAIILISNNDHVVILDKRKKKAFSINTIGREKLFEGFKNQPENISIKIADIPGIIFGLKKQIIKNNADKELEKIILNLTKVMLSPSPESKAYYLTENGKTAYIFLNSEKNHLFVVNNNQDNYFTLIISDNLTTTEFLNLIVKGVLQ